MKFELLKLTVLMRDIRREKSITNGWHMPSPRPGMSSSQPLLPKN
jgi:hypothetical protein